EGEQIEVTGIFCWRPVHAHRKAVDQLAIHFLKLVYRVRISGKTATDELERFVCFGWVGHCVPGKLSSQAVLQRPSNSQRRDGRNRRFIASAPSPRQVVCNFSSVLCISTAADRLQPAVAMGECAAV